MTSPTQTIDMIPLNKLIASPRNVRRKDRKVDIDALAASIAACGLLQNLCVVPKDNGRFEVDAGGRRLAALKQLAQAGAIAKDYPVPCHVIAPEDGREISLIENIHRVGMDAMDEVEAYATLLAEGRTADEVAHRFGVTRRHVDQRLALAGLSPKIKAAWKRGEVTLEAARAFCLVEDHAQQDAVFRSLSRPITHPGSVRARLMEGRMRASDRLACYVGLEAYERAGGALVRDLFDNESVFIADPALITRLAEEKLELEAKKFAGEGWGWTGVQLGSGMPASLSTLRLHPTLRPLTQDEQAELDRLRAEREALDEALDTDSVEDDPRWDVHDVLSAAMEAIRQTARVWDPELIAHAGSVLGLNHAGEVTTSLGLVRRADEKAIKAIGKRREAAEQGEQTPGESDKADGVEASWVEPEDRLPKCVIRDLSRVRTQALRLTLSQDVDTALAVAVAAMLSRSVFATDLPGVGVTCRSASFDDLESLAQARGVLESCLPSEQDGILSWCLDQHRETLLRILAVLVAGSIDLVHEKGSQADRDKRAAADTLATALDLDMSAYWSADIDYWSRLTKAELLALMAETPEAIALSDERWAAIVSAHGKLKKDDLAAKVAEAFDGSGYLPDLLITAPVAGAYVVTEAGCDAIAA